MTRELIRAVKARIVEDMDCCNEVDESLRLRDALSTYVADIRKRRSESWYVWPAFVDQEDDL